MSAENTPYNERTRAIRRRAAASRAAFALHEQRPELAAEAGRKGGQARAENRSARQRASAAQSSPAESSSDSGSKRGNASDQIMFFPGIIKQHPGIYDWFIDF